MHWPPDEDDSKPKRAADGPRVGIQHAGMGIQQQAWHFSGHGNSVGMEIQQRKCEFSGHGISVGMDFQQAKHGNSAGMGFQWP